MDNEGISRRSRLPASVRRLSARKGNGNGNKNPLASIANLDHHRLFREVERLRRHGQEVLARTRQMMNLLSKTLARAQSYVDEQHRRSTEIGNDRTPMDSRKFPAERAKNEGPSRPGERRPA